MPADRLTELSSQGRHSTPDTSERRQGGGTSGPLPSPQSGPARSLRHLAVRLTLAWLATRATMLTIWLVALVGFAVPSARGDVAYYFRAISSLGTRGPAATMIEYPTPVVALTWLMYAITQGNGTAFLVAFVVLMVGCDAAFTWLLWRHAGQGRAIAVGFWIAFVFLLGPTVFLRFDLLPAVLTATALVAATGGRPKPRLAGALVACGTALKLWPAATWPSTWGPDRRSRWRSTVGALAVGGLVAGVSVWWAGWERLVSPVTWQRERGLQIESVFATVPMIGRALDPTRYVVAMSRFQAFEINGPGTTGWESAASLAALLGYLAVAATAILLWRRPASDAVAPTVVMILAAVILVVANKTFSPQYMLWIGAPVAAGLARLANDGVGERDHSSIRQVAVLVLGLTAATALVYPIGYRPLIYGLPGVGLVTAVLTIRNLGMLVLVAVLLRWAWSSLVKRRSA